MFFEDIKNRLRAHGSKLTPQRRAVLDVIISNKGEHMSSEEIYDLVRKNLPDVGLATVYRTLQLLCRIGVLSRVNLDDNVARYELNSDEGKHQHHHLICDKCGKIQEVHVDLLEDLERYIEREFEFEIVNHKLKFNGYCKDCSK